MPLLFISKSNPQMVFTIGCGGWNPVPEEEA